MPGCNLQENADARAVIGLALSLRDSRDDSDGFVLTMPTISISIVSHMQAHLLAALLNDLEEYGSPHAFEVLLTLNIPEELSFDIHAYSFPVIVIANREPKGFGANHNQAFRRSSGTFYCVLNPDVRLSEDVFVDLLACLNEEKAGVAAPVVLGASGEVEDSARRFPSPIKIFCKLLGRCRGSDYVITVGNIYPDWVAGMFMIFRRGVFQEIGGFDERYFLYYEDVDICARLRLQGYKTVLCTRQRIFHYAQRTSHRSLKYLKWHLSSMLRFFCSPTFLRVQWLRLVGR